MARLSLLPTASLPAFGLAAGAAALGLAHLIQSQGHVPCALCYLERWPYWAAILLGVLGFLAAPARSVLRPLLALVFLAAATLGALHTGVEFGWWKSPLPECAAPILNTASVQSLLHSLPARPAKPCDAPTFIIPGLPISMAGLNLLYALALLAALALPARTPKAQRS